MDSVIRTDDAFTSPLSPPSLDDSAVLVGSAADLAAAAVLLLLL